MSCKTPILMAIDGVSRELVENASAGRYVEPENPKEYSRIIREYMENPKLLKKHGENGYFYAKKNFDRKLLADQYIKRISKISNLQE